MSDIRLKPGSRIEFSDDSGPFPTEGVIEVGNGFVDASFTVPREPMHVFMTGLVEWFIAAGGKNYVEQHLSSQEGQFSVLVQKVGGETPAQQNGRLRGEVTQLQTELRQVREELEAARKDRARLDYMIAQSNQGNGWLSDDVWDAAAETELSNTVADPDPRLTVRQAIDLAIAQEPPCQG